MLNPRAGALECMTADAGCHAHVYSREHAGIGLTGQPGSMLRRVRLSMAPVNHPASAVMHPVGSRRRLRSQARKDGLPYNGRLGLPRPFGALPCDECSCCWPFCVSPRSVARTARLRYRTMRGRRRHSRVTIVTITMSRVRSDGLTPRCNSAPAGRACRCSLTIARSAG